MNTCGIACGAFGNVVMILLLVRMGEQPERRFDLLRYSLPLVLYLTQHTCAPST